MNDAADGPNKEPKPIPPTLGSEDTPLAEVPKAEAPIEVTLSVRVCRRCSMQSSTTGKFCPGCGTAFERTPLWKNKKVAIATGVATVIVIVAATIGVITNVQRGNQERADQAAAEASAHAAASASAAAASRSAAAAEAEASASAAVDEAARSLRKDGVKELEASVLKDAKKRVEDGTLDGPISRVSCTPLGGGSTDDLTAITTTFECIAVNKTETDGQSSGYVFSAVMNWNEGNYSWHLGR